jgi:hypothetical protein
MDVIAIEAEIGIHVGLEDKFDDPTPGGGVSSRRKFPAKLTPFRTSKVEVSPAVPVTYFGSRLPLVMYIRTAKSSNHPP